MKTLPINNKVIGVVEVPETIKHSVSSDNRLLYLTHPATPWKSIDLPHGNWQILGRASDLTNKQDELRGLLQNVNGYYKDYTGQFIGFGQVLNSWQSFLKANQIKDTDLILIKG